MGNPSETESQEIWGIRENLIDGWIDRATDGSIDGWMDRPMADYLLGSIDRLIDGSTDRGMDGWMDRWIDR